MMLSTVGKQLKRATQIRKTHTPEQQAENFYQMYRVILVKEDTYKQKIMQLKEEVKHVQEGNSELEHLRKRTLTILDRNKALRTQVLKLQQQLSEFQGRALDGQGQKKSLLSKGLLDEATKS